MTTIPQLSTRPATLEDASAIAHIYNQGIEDRSSTFETRPRTAQDIEGWFDGQHPIVVVERDGQVIAFANTSTGRTTGQRGVESCGLNTWFDPTAEQFRDRPGVIRHTCCHPRRSIHPPTIHLHPK